MTTVFFVGPREDPDRIKLGAAVASGTEGVLYRGYLPTESTWIDVAVKMLQPGHLDRLEDWTARWRDQAELLRRVKLPGLVTVRGGFVGPLPHPEGDSDRSTSSLYLVMDWIDGVSLDRWLRKVGEASPEQLLAVLVPVAAALDLLHAGAATNGEPVVHCDVKPANILVRPAGDTVLVDLGSLRALDSRSRQPGMTGTPGYIAPEVRHRSEYGPAADRYSVGAVAFFLLTETEPPIDATLDDLRALLERAPRVAGRPEVVQHVCRMLDPNPSARPSSIANWVAQLRRSSMAFLPGDVAIAPVAPTRQPGQGSGVEVSLKSRHRGRAATAVALAVLVAVAGFLVVRPRGAGVHTGTSLPVSADGAWQPIPPAPIHGRSDTSAVWTGHEMVVWGGFFGQETFNDGARYDPALKRWRTVAESPLTPRRAASVVWTGEEALFWGGDGNVDYSADPADITFNGAAYNPHFDTWRMLPPSPFRPRAGYTAGFAAFWTGEEMLLWGDGNLGRAPVGALYNPKTNTWRTMASSPHEPHAFYASQYAGHELITWMGPDISHVNSGAPLAAAYSVDSNSWRTIDNPPTGTAVSAAAGDTVVFVGDDGVDTSKSVLYTFDPGATGWRTTPLSPNVYAQGPGYWTGRGLLATEGSPPNERLSTAGRLLVIGLDARVHRLIPANIPSRSPAAVIWAGDSLIEWSGTIPTPGANAQAFDDGYRYVLPKVFGVVRRR